MKIKMERVDRNSVVLFLSGRLDTTSASTFERKLKQFVERSIDITLDFKELNYISSSGLHVLLQTLKVMNKNKRKFIIKNICELVREVFEMTGFIDLITVE